MKGKPLSTQSSSSFARRFLMYGIFAIVATVLGLVGFLSRTYHYAYVHSIPDGQIEITDTTPPFPIGVNPSTEEITENPSVESYLDTNLTDKDIEETSTISLMRPLVGQLALFSWYQNLASAATRILVIQPGERREQVAHNFGKILGWSDDEKREFTAAVISLDPILFEGKFAPGTYVVARDAEPYDVALLVTEKFAETILDRYPDDIDRVVPLEDALTIASLLEREAAGFEDMRYISGIIWNRLFVDMKLQIDATLQYAKGEKSKKTWWPRVIPDDKYIDSSYNTYQHTGLPPTPIANASANAILAALNPRETECMYYFHDKKANFHCSVTYEDHVKLLKQYYGRGK